MTLFFFNQGRIEKPNVYNTLHILHIMKISKLIITVILLFSAISIVYSIADANKPATFSGSFDNKFNRYSQYQTHNALNELQLMADKWCDTVWKNDRAHSQLVLWIENSHQNTKCEISYEIGDLKSNVGVIQSSNINVRFPQYIIGDSTATECNKHHENREQVYIADALSEQTSSSLSKKDPLKLWITVDIPKDTPQGRYEGKITIKDKSGYKKDFFIDLLVAGKTLPDVKDWTFHLDIWQFPFQLSTICAKNGDPVEPFSDDYMNLMRPFYKILADGGQKVVTTYIKDGAFRPDQTMVNWTRLADNTWHFGYTNFDRYVEFMFDLGIDKQISCFSPGGWDKSIGYREVGSSERKVKFLEVGSPDYNNTWTIFLKSFREHLNEKGWFDKVVLYLDEVPDAVTKKIIKMIRDNGSDWKIGIAGSRHSAEVEAEFYDYSVFLGYDKKVESNPISTFYTSCSHPAPNNYVSKETSPSEMVWMAWYAKSQNYNGYLRWAFDYWMNEDPTNVQDGGNTAGDCNMIYRSDNSKNSQAIASIRFAMLREGIQDFEKIKILNNEELNKFVSEIKFEPGTNYNELIGTAQSLLKRVSINE